jgi:ribonuclease Z
MVNLPRNQRQRRPFSMIDLVLLGTGAMVPLPNRWLSSLLVRVNGSLVLFDCGEGTQIAMREVGWGFKRLDAIVLSHHHADHVAGLPGLFHTLANSGRTEKVRIYGPPGTGDIVRALRSIAVELPYPMEVYDISGGDTMELAGGLVATTTWADHRIPCLAWRCDLRRTPAFDVDAAAALEIPRQYWSRLQRGENVSNDGIEYAPEQVLTKFRPGVAFGFATDTRPSDAIVKLMRDVHLLISEATFAEDELRQNAIDHKHMTFGEAATLARDAHARHLWLTHFSARIANPEDHLPLATSIFPNTQTGYTGLTGTIRYDRGFEPSM